MLVCDRECICVRFREWHGKTPTHSGLRGGAARFYQYLYLRTIDAVEVSAHGLSRSCKLGAALGDQVDSQTNLKHCSRVQIQFGASQKGVQFVRLDVVA